MTSPTPAPPPYAPPTGAPVWRPWPPPLASVQDRALAYLVDVSLLGAISFVVALMAQQVVGLLFSLGLGVIGLAASGTAGEDVAVTVALLAAVVAAGTLGIVLSVLVSAVCFWFVPARMQGQTVGKRLLGLRAVRRDLRPATTWTHARRWLALYVDSALYGVVGLVLVLTSSPPRRLGDRWADTVVVKG